MARLTAALLTMVHDDPEQVLSRFRALYGAG
jgi:hypothetical protein